MKRIMTVAVSAFLFAGCGFSQLLTPAEWEEQTQRFYALNRWAKESLAAGRTDDARLYAEELLALLPQYKDDWNFGNAVHDANLVLGRIAVVNGQIDEAKKYLIKAGKTPGSPQLNSFGPDMSLARDLLEQGETEVVLEYFEHCRKFWKRYGATLDAWSATVKNGGIPDFSDKSLIKSMLNTSMYEESNP
jgi:tetratricopeptide (TPR) repeat protein